ncbi:ABC transporter permease [Hydrogenovibrio thermophilus]|jgi:NitT/TauT family transport system permease protein|uniref:ABC transporter permease subunit n=1 Tax=Hydrogenovibrio thermophilus TaxID=265883 RepID=A0A451G4J9_9GAMM|nr:ABC transporter permease subunit [Hydrogenovibrio thermophilus]QAB14400.1 ABC transporter permease subunit [Hydrogenovibrio thermophilus]
MNAFAQILKEFPRYLWSGWGALASIFLFLALWDIGHQFNGSLILPSPKETLLTLWQMLQSPELWQSLWITVQRALWGFGIALLLGTSFGMLAGTFVTAAMMSRPLITIIMGVPPIAWIVLAMLWFGMTDESVIFTVVIAAFPIIFIGALQGTRTLEGDLLEMSDSFQPPFWMKLTDLVFPHLFSYVFPAWISALGMSWKIVVMAELLTTPDGIGADLAVARSHFNSADAMALITVMVLVLLVVEYLLLEPIKREVEQWRN